MSVIISRQNYWMDLDENLNIDGLDPEKGHPTTFNCEKGVVRGSG